MDTFEVRDVEQDELTESVTHDGDGAPMGDPASAPPKKRRRWLWILAAALAVAAIAGGAILIGNLSGGDETEAVVTRNTATVRVADLAVTETLDGTLGYTEGDSVLLRSSIAGGATIISRLNGTVTATPQEGTTLTQGDVIYEVDGEPVVLLSGETAAYRTLNGRSDDGPDIQQLEEALVALGYDPDGDVAIDEEFDSDTEAMVERWQANIGASETGVVQLGAVVFRPGPVTVGSVQVTEGAVTRDGDPVLQTSTSPGGTITAVVDEGEVMAQGDQLFRVDDQPVILLFGDVPAYRAMSVGVQPGNDVAQLELALVELGYGQDGLVLVDGVFDAATEAAVIAWQADTGAQADGVVELGEVVFLPGSIRVASVLKSPGDPARDGEIVLVTSSNETFVTVRLSTEDQDLVAVGDSVAVELPDGTDVSATVTEIGGVAQTGQDGVSYFEMTVSLDDASAAAGLDEAPVDVDVVSDAASQVLAVPVTALVALSEGGYAVEVQGADGTTRLIAVETGLFADGTVEVTDSGLEAGMLVIVP
jgi:peptidoglycan hydrolase-like protein with peptidoglycan-binding domain